MPTPPPETAILDERAVEEIELWRGRAQSLIDWQNGVPMSVATEGGFYISALLQNIPPAFIVTVCNRAKDAKQLHAQLTVAIQEREDLQSQLEQLRAENHRLTESLNKTNTLGEEMLTRMEKVAGIGTKADHGWYYVMGQVESRLAQVGQERDELSTEMETCHALLDQFYSEDPAMTSGDTLEQRLKLHLDELRPVITDSDVSGDD